jgi:hypothetical protein
VASTRGGQIAAKVLAAIGVAARKAETVRVGFLASAKYPDGTPVAMVAAIQDFGTPKVKVPSRPFFRQMIKSKSSEWPKAVGDLLIINKFDADKTLRQVGEAVAGQLRQSITDFSGAPLKPATIKRKGFDKQLIDTSVMLKSVDFEVK